LATDTFSSLKNIKIKNQSRLKIIAGSGGDIKVSDLIVTETNVATPPNITLFSLRLLLMFDSLAFYNVTNPSTITSFTLSDN
jgi:hypothetical protein